VEDTIKEPHRFGVFRKLKISKQETSRMGGKLAEGKKLAGGLNLKLRYEWK